MPTLDDVLSFVLAYVDEEWSWLIVATFLFLLVGVALSRLLDRREY